MVNLTQDELERVSDIISGLCPHKGHVHRSLNGCLSKEVDLITRKFGVVLQEREEE